jgi:hypothetical protein
MAGLGGTETSRRLTAAHPDIVVVLVSADDDPALTTVPSSCGAATFLPKESLRPSVVAGLWSRHAPLPPPAPATADVPAPEPPTRVARST